MHWILSYRAAQQIYLTLLSANLNQTNKKYPEKFW